MISMISGLMTPLGGSCSGAAGHPSSTMKIRNGTAIWMAASPRAILRVHRLRHVRDYPPTSSSTAFTGAEL